MNEFTECSVCMINYDSRDRVPMLLECQHSFCKICLDKLIRDSIEFRCPTCRAIERRNISQIQKNRMILNFIEMNNINTSATKSSMEIPAIPSPQHTSPKKQENSIKLKEWSMSDYLKESFDQIDHNKDGTISTDELHEALIRGQPNMQFDKKTAQILMEQYDKNNDDEISFSEFYDLFMAINELYNEFLDYDADNSGYIEANELYNAVRKYQGFESLSSSFFNYLIAELSGSTHVKGISFDIMVRIISRLYGLKYEFESFNHEFSLEEFIKRNFFIKF